jgi:vitamin K-dependent gamma-carboxylase
MRGYSLSGLSNKWVFDPFRPFLSNELIDLLLVHISGLCYDLFVGFFLLFDKTRLMGILFSLAFHGMNSQIFSIGMFAYTMMASLPVFCSYDWPKKILSCLPFWMRFATPLLDEAKPSSTCLYSVQIDDEKRENEEVKPKKDKDNSRRSGRSTQNTHKNYQVTFPHKIMLSLFACYVGCQCFLPYSHFITKVIRKLR